MKLAYIAIKRPVATLTLIALFVVVGVVSLLFTPLDLLPDIQPPVLAVVTLFPGSSPQETLSMVSMPIEDRVSVVSGLTRVSSISQESVSLAILRFQWGADMKAARDEVELNLSLLRLPDGVQQPMVLEFDPTLLPVMELSATGEMDNAQLTQWLQTQVKPRLERIPGVANVQLQGEVVEDYFVRLSPEAMEKNSISFEQVAGILGGSLQDLPAGIIELDQRQLRMRFMGQSHDRDVLAGMIVGFNVNETALEKQLQQTINIDLNKALASALPADAAPEIPMRTIYFRDVVAAVDRDAWGTITAIIFDWERLAEYGLNPEIVAEIIGIELPGPGEDWTLPEDVDWQAVLDMPVTEIPDLEAWVAQTRIRLSRELDQASRELEAALSELALGLMLSSRGGSMPGLGADFPLDPVTLQDISAVEKAAHVSTNVSRLNGMPSIGMSVQKEGSANTVAVARAVRQELNNISRESISAGTEIGFYYVYDQAADIENALRDLVQSLLGGALLAIIILILFLKDIRTTLFIGAAIPISLLFTFTLLYFANLTVNIMTMGAMALAAGLLVDNAIVVSENIYRHLQMGASPGRAALVGTQEVAGAILASTLTTISVFFPVVFVSGLAGELFREFALTVSFALAASLAVSFTLIPLMASRFLTRDSKVRTVFAPGFYLKTLKLALARPWAVLTLVFIFVLGSGLLYTTLGTDLFPMPQEPSFSISIDLPPGTPLRETDAFMAKVEAIIWEHEDVDFYHARAGGAEFMGISAQTGVTNQARMRVVVTNAGLRNIDILIEDLRQKVAALDANAEINFSRDSLLEAAGIESRLELTVLGDDPRRVNELVDQAVALMAELDFLSDVQSDRDQVRPEVHIDVNHPLALQQGVSIYQVANTLRMAMEGIPIARVQDPQGTYQLVLGYSRQELVTLDDIRDLTIYTATGNLLALGEVATFTEAFGPVMIPRENRQMVGRISAYFSDLDLGAATDKAMAALQDLELPLGYEIRPDGAFVMMDDAFAELQTILFVSALLVYLVMAAQFESFRNPLIIVCSIPLALGGSVLALFITGSSLSIPALIGAVVLCGILVNDGIIMVDLITQHYHGGMPLLEAVTQGASSRLRPILMTTITTVLGLFPLALGLGAGSQLQAPMAITIIGGQIVGTLLLLVVIPVLYLLLNKSRKQGWLQRPVLIDEED